MATSTADPSTSTAAAAYFDIISAAMFGYTPKFASAYQSTLFSSSPGSLGIRAFNGCDDRVLYIISEIVYLEMLKAGITAAQLSDCAPLLNRHLQRYTSDAETRIFDHTLEIGVPFANGFVPLPSDLIVAAFRVAARIYLLSLLPDFRRRSDTVRALVEQLVHPLTLLCERDHRVCGGLTWVYIIGEAASVRGDRFRVLLEAKLLMEAMLGRTGNKSSGKSSGFVENGGFGDVLMKLTELWERDDDVREGMGKWRDVLKSFKW